MAVGDVNEVTSILDRPAADSALHSAILSSVGTKAFPSAGHRAGRPPCMWMRRPAPAKRCWVRSLHDSFAAQQRNLLGIEPHFASTASVSSPRCGALLRMVPGVAESLARCPALPRCSHRASLASAACRGRGSGVFGNVLGGVDLACRHAGGAQRVQHLLHGALRAPGANGRVDFHTRHAAGVVGQVWRGAQVGLPMASIRRLKMLSPLPATSTQPSVQGRRCSGQCPAAHCQPPRAPRRRRCIRGSGFPSR